MLQVFPDYYSDFRCIAGACRHSCCIGWEIDIDPDTLETYRRVPGAFGARLAAAIEDSECGAHFRLGPDERCPFLNERGLCDLIIELGEDRLCHICADHPRFRNYFSDRTEIGIGLCCEAAAQLILSQEAPMRLVVLEDDGETEDLWQEEADVLDLRDGLLVLAQDRNLPVADRVQRMLDECGISLPERPFTVWAEIYRSLERLDPAWDGMLDQLAALEGSAPELDKTLEQPLEQLLSYLIYRHLPGAAEDENAAGRIAFVALSWQMICWLCMAQLLRYGVATLDSLAEIARMYSSEIEYSDENIETLLACLMQDQPF